MQYPDARIIARCGMLHDNGDDTAKLLEMWSRVKGDNASGFTYIVIVAAVVLLIGAAVYNSQRKKKRHSHKRK